MLGSHEIANAECATLANFAFDDDADFNDRQITDMVASAIENEQVVLAFQPVMQARDTKKVAFYEGLIRVLDGAGQIIPAGAFIASVEETSLGRALDTLALREGLRTLFENPHLRISINMSALSIGHAAWDRILHQWLEKDETLAERLIIEITESSALRSPVAVMEFMHRLQLMGISFAMDDFGSGYTALRHFKEFSFDIIKIDGQFIRGISHCPDNRAVTAALVAIAKHFEMMIVAEFVETKEDADTLYGMGVDCLQGYHFGAPNVRPAWAASVPFAQAV